MKMLIKCYKTFIYFDKFNVHSYNEAFLFENNNKNKQKFPLCNIEIFLLKENYSALFFKEGLAMTH